MICFKRTTNLISLKCIRHFAAVAVPKVSKKSDLIIECKRAEFNFYNDSNTGKLASKAWDNRKSIGDHFTLYPNSKTQDITVFEKEIRFSQLGITPELTKVLNELEITTPTSIQARAIPKVLTGANCLIGSHTGSGKTLAYLLPMLEHLRTWKEMFKDRPLNSPLALILLPGRELAAQIVEIVNRFSDLGLKSSVVIGGRTKHMMVEPVFEECDLLIGTLGAVSKLTTTGIYKMGWCMNLTMDEADTLLDDSFNDKLRYFLKHFRLQYGGHNLATNEGTQLLLAAATLPTNLKEFFETILPIESIHHITTPLVHSVLPNVPQKFLRVSRSRKPFELLRLVKSRKPAIVFSNKSSTCDWVSLFLNSQGVSCVNLNGDMPMIVRQGVFRKFQEGFVDIISSTDIGSRGLDTGRAVHIINFDFPLHTADYIHRVGRVGRIGSPELSYVTNLVSGSQEIQVVNAIEEAVRSNGGQIKNVNGNITQVIMKKVLKSIRNDISNINKM